MGVISTGNRNIIVSEFVSGGTLSNYIKNKQSTVIERLKIALNIATGLAWYFYFDKSKPIVCEYFFNLQVTWHYSTHYSPRFKT